MIKRSVITNKTFILTAVVGCLLIMGMMTANALRASKEANTATDKAVSSVSSFYLEAMADRRAKTITNLIGSNFEDMEAALHFIQNEDIRSQDEFRQAIGKVKALLSLQRFALVDEDDIVYTQYTTYTGKSRHAFLNDDATATRTISTVSIYGSSKQLCLTVPTPDLQIMGKNFKACFVQIDINDIVDLLTFDDQGRTYFGLYTKNGVNLSGTQLGPVIDRGNLFESLEKVVSGKEINTLRSSFLNEKSGSITFDSGETSETLSFVPIEGTGWEMAVLIKESVINDQIRDISENSLRITRNQIIFTLISVFLLAVILLLMLRKLSKDKLAEEQEKGKAIRDMANTDTMTGVRNKHAYTEFETQLNQKITAGELDKLAVIVCDVNGLKHVNDTKGHAAGDQLIKDACNLLSEYFMHGSVFRTGGDEFVVLLQAKGYDKRQESIDAFNRKVEANIAAEEVVVSIGHSILQPGDRTLRDIFERADQLMYERKKQLKAMGPKTRE